MEENMRRDPYEVLGVSRNAGKAEIRKAYHKLALRHHPDKCNGDAEAKARATKRFAEIGHAYETLTNPEAAAAATATGGEGPMYDDYGGAAGGGFGNPFFPARPPGPFPSAFPAASVFGGMFHETDPFMMGMGGMGAGGPFFHFTDPFELFERTFGKAAFDGDGDGGVFGVPAAMIPPGGGGFSTVSFSSSSMGPNTGGMRTISTSTQVVNGRRTTKTETTVIHPDGRRETFVEVDGGDGRGANSAPPRLSQHAHPGAPLPAGDGPFGPPSPVEPPRVDVGARAATPPRAESHKRPHGEMTSARQPGSPPPAARPAEEVQRRDGRLGTPENGAGPVESRPRVFVVGENDKHEVIDLSMSPIVSPTDQDVRHDDGAGGEGATTEGPIGKHPRHGYEEEAFLPVLGPVDGWPTQQHHDGRNGNLAGVMPRVGIGNENGRNALFSSSAMQGTQEDRGVESCDTAESSPRAGFDQNNREKRMFLDGGVQHPSGITGLNHPGEKLIPVAAMGAGEPFSHPGMSPGGQSANAASDVHSYYSLTVPFLKEKLRERGLTVSGRKAELIERLLKSEGEQS